VRQGESPPLDEPLESFRERSRRCSIICSFKLEVLLAPVPSSEETGPNIQEEFGEGAVPQGSVPFRGFKRSSQSSDSLASAPTVSASKCQAEDEKKIDGGGSQSKR